MQAKKSILIVYAQKNDETLSESIYQKFIVLLAEAYDSIEILSQPNSVELFQRLKKKNILVVLNTGYNVQTAESIIDKLGWKKGVEFDGLVTATDVEHNRPQPDMILFAMKKFNISDAHKVVKVGDSAIDIEEGKNAGCSLSIGITTGAHTLEQLQTAKPDYIINNLLELLPLLDNK